MPASYGGLLILTLLALFLPLHTPLAEEEGDLVSDAILLPSRGAVLSLPTEAMLRELRVKEGQFVQKGSVMAVLYSPAELLDRDRAVKRAEMAGFQLQVSEKLRAGSIVSEESARQREIDHAIAAIDAEQVKAALADKTLVAPFDGCVLRIFKDEGESVGRVEGIIELVDFSELHVDTYLEAAYFGLVQPGDRVRVRIGSPAEVEREAVVQQVDPVVDAASGLFRARAVLPNPGHTIPSGVPATMIIPRPSK